MALSQYYSKQRFSPPRGKELTESQNEENRKFSRQRVICEHAHAGIKRCRSVTDVYRNRVTADR